ncbi:hypothetical protein Tco_1308328, partial [Tanacetum coccineum]
TKVSSSFADLSNIGSPRVDGPPVMPEDPYAYVVAAFQAPPSPDYVSGPEEPEQAPPSPIYVPYVPEPVYPEFMPPEEEVFPTEEQPLPAAVSPTANSPGYIADSAPEEDPTDYPADEGDDDDDDDDDENDDDDVEEDEDNDKEEEVEHLAPANSTTVAFPAVDHVPSAEETEPFETDESAATPLPHPAYRVAKLLAIPTPPPSPLSPWSSPLPHIPSPPLPSILSPLPASPPLPVLSPPPLVSPIYPLGYKAAMIRLRAETPSTSHPTPFGIPPSGTQPLLPIPAPTSSPPLMLPSTDHRADRPEVCLPPQKRLCIAAGPRYEVGESSSAVAARPTRGFRADYHFIATIDRDIRRDPEREFATRVRQDMDEIYVRLDDAQSKRQLMARRLNMLDRDRRAHARTTLLMEREARMSQEAWGWSMDASDLARNEVRALRTQTAKETTDPDDRVPESAGTH